MINLYSSISLLITEIQIKIAMMISRRLAKIKISSDDEYVKWEFSVLSNVIINWYNHFGKQLETFSKGKDSDY